jgi:hypothetical protein
LLKIYVCDVIKTLLSMKVKYVYGIQNRKYTGGAVQEKKAWNTVRVISYQFYLYINVIIKIMFIHTLIRSIDIFSFLRSEVVFRR